MWHLSFKIVELFFKKPRSLHHTEYVLTKSRKKKKKVFLEDQDSDIVLRSSNSNGAEKLMVISYADLFISLFLPRL